MPTLTDSFCERCGTRYVFSEPAPKRPSIKSARVFARGLKNFVLTDGQTISESIALARNDDDHEDSTRITEAFHRTFNFCMTCRQYACDKCWNEKQGACLTCSPDSDLLPNAPEDRLIIRTPVAHNDDELARLAAVDPARFAPQPDRPSWPAADPVAAPLARVGALPGGIPARKLFPAADQGDPMAWASAVQGQAQTEPLDIMSWGKPRAAAETAAPASKPQPQADWSLWPVSEAQERAGGAELQPAADVPAADTDEPQAETEMPVEAALGAAEAVDAASGPVEAAPETFDATPEPLEAAAAPEAEMAAPEPEPVQAALAPDVEPIAAVAGPQTQGWTGDSEGSEMALTPSELMLVEAELAQAGPGEAPAAADLAAAADLLAAPASIAASPAPDPAAQTPWMPAHTLAEDAALPLARPTLLHMRRLSEPRVAAGWEPESAQTSHATSPVEQEPRHTPAVARLFGREAAVPAPQPVPVAPEAAADPWPRPTAWRDRPIKAHDWFGQPTPASMPSPAVVEWTLEPAAPAPPAAAQPAPVPQPPTLAQPLPQSPMEALDLRAAALAQALPEPAQEDRSPLFVLPITPAAQRPGDERAAGWPPLGASFPTPSRNGGWPGQADAGLPAVIAAQAAQPDMASMWAQSSQEVMNRGSVRVCHKCALPVSTHARFCRRCGTEQA
jgi:ribosomal protein L40E